MPWCHAGYSIEEAKAWLTACQTEWARGTSYPFLVVETNSDTVLGSVDINQINRDHNFGNIGYWVRSSHTGKGLATAAVRMAAQFGFNEAGFTGSKLSHLPTTQQVAVSLKKRVLSLNALS